MGFAKHRQRSKDTPEVGDPARESDDELLHRLQRGDLDAFEVFFARHSTPIYRTAYALTGDPQVAEEVLQDTFVRAYDRRATLRSGMSPLPWLHRVALNLCYTRLRQRRVRWEPISQALGRILRDLSGEPHEFVEQRELSEIVRAGIAALPPKQQSVVGLYYLRELSIQETADVLGVRPGTVKSRLHYGLRALRTHLEQDRRFGGAYVAPVRPAQDKAEAGGR
jgi:RNA polymerase sigma-70 factor, ECF subfamily